MRERSRAGPIPGGKAGRGENEMRGGGRERRLAGGCSGGRHLPPDEEDRMTHWAGTFSTPLGSMAAVIANDGALTQLDFLGERMASVVVRALDVRWDDSAIAPVAGPLAG